MGIRLIDGVWDLAYQIQNAGQQEGFKRGYEEALIEVRARVQRLIDGYNGDTADLLSLSIVVVEIDHRLRDGGWAS